MTIVTKFLLYSGSFFYYVFVGASCGHIYIPSNLHICNVMITGAEFSDVLLIPMFPCHCFMCSFIHPLHPTIHAEACVT